MYFMLVSENLFISFICNSSGWAFSIKQKRGQIRTPVNINRLANFFLPQPSLHEDYSKAPFTMRQEPFMH